jgi:hypothetical protein
MPTSKWGIIGTHRRVGERFAQLVVKWDGRRFGCCKAFPVGGVRRGAGVDIPFVEVGVAQHVSQSQSCMHGHTLGGEASMLWDLVAGSSVQHAVVQ